MSRRKGKGRKKRLNLVFDGVLKTKWGRRGNVFRRVIRIQLDV